MGATASQITSLTIVCTTVYSGADQRKHQSSASLVFVWGIHRGPLNSPHKWPVTQKMFSFDDVIMENPLHIAHMMETTQILNMNYAIWHKTSFATTSLQQILVFLNVASFLAANLSTRFPVFTAIYDTSNGSWCIGIKGEMSGTVCVTFTWDIYIYMSCL